MTEISWIKLKTKMFDDEKIQLIEAMPEADAILVIWVKLLIQAGKSNSNGYILLSENIPYSPEMLSTIFRRPLPIIKFALKTFSELGMIEVTDSNVICISNWEKHQNIEGLDKVREQNRRRQARRRSQNLLNSGRIGYCAYCNKEDTLTIDHIIPTSKGGEDIAENCVLACWECNHSKTSRDLAVFLNERLEGGLPVDINSITHNKKLTNVISYKDGKFYQKQTTNHVTVTPRHTTDIEYKIKNKNKNKNIIMVNGKEIIVKDYFLDLLPIDSSQQFIEAWVEWVDFRKEIRKKLTKITANKQINFLLKQPDPIKCLNQSIQNGWQGLFEVENKQKLTKPSINLHPTTTKVCQAPNCDKPASVWSDGFAGCCYEHIMLAKKTGVKKNE